jgi:hypothetical protein
MEPGNHSERHDQIERSRLESDRVRVAEAYLDLFLGIGRARLRTCQLDHGQCAIRGCNAESTLSQGYGRRARPAAQVQYAGPRRQIETIDVGEDRESALLVHRGPHAVVRVDVAPGGRVCLEPCIYLTLDDARCRPIHEEITVPSPVERP